VPPISISRSRSPIAAEPEPASATIGMKSGFCASADRPRRSVRRNRGLLRCGPTLPSWCPEQHFNATINVRICRPIGKLLDTPFPYLKSSDAPYNGCRALIMAAAEYPQRVASAVRQLQSNPAERVHMGTTPRSLYYERLSVCHTVAALQNCVIRTANINEVNRASGPMHSRSALLRRI
jgi:hypothetical protein